MRSDLKKERRCSGLFSRILSLIVILCVLVLSVTSISSNVIFRKIMISTVQSMEETYLNVQKDRLDSLVDRYRYSVYGLAVDSELLKYAKILDSGEDVFEAKQKIYLKLQEAASTTEVVSVTFNPTNDKFICYSHIFTSHFSNWWYSNVENEKNNRMLAELCKRAEEKKNIVFGTQPNKLNNLSCRFFHIACPVYDLMTKTFYGTVVFSFDLDLIQKTANPLCRQEEISNGIIVAPDGNIVAHKDERWIGEPFIDERSAAERGILPREAMIINHVSGRYGFDIYGVIDDKVITQRITHITTIQTLSVSVVIICIFLIMMSILRHMSSSTKKLVSGLKKLSTGDFTTVIPVTDTHEIGKITMAVNHLSRQLQILKDKDQMQTKQTLDALNQQHLAEMRVLEQQINAHFLYNTLNTMNYTAIENDDEMVSKQIHELSVILRYALEKREESVTVEQVKEWLEAYLYLQKLRYGSRFEYSIVMDDEMKDWPMRKLLVQPFVENAVLHGFEDRQFGGYLNISFKRFNQEKMRITIADNGRGIDANQCRKINDFFLGKKEDLPFSKGVGLINAHQRMKVYYNNRAKVFYRSAPNVKTVVTILLPPYQKSESSDSVLR